MKKQFLLPLVAAAGGIAAFALRLAQNQTGFEPDTGLPIPGNAAAIALVVLLVALAAALVVLSRRLSVDGSPSFPADFSTPDATLLMLPVAGVFFIGLSGALDLLMGTGFLGHTAVELPGIGTLFLFASSGFSSTQHLLMGALSLVSAVTLFPAVSSCLKKGSHEAPSRAEGIYLLPPVFNLVVRLVLTYRTVSVNPSLETYYVELLALVVLTLGFYRLASFGFCSGSPRLFSLYSGAATVLALAALADSGAFLPATLLYAGGAAVLTGLQILLITAPAAPAETGTEPDA